MKRWSVVLIAAALSSFVIAAVLALAGSGGGTGPLVVAGFVALAVGARGHAFLRSFSFTIWIFAAVAASLYYPQYFLRVGDFDLKRLIVPLIQVIMFGMGTAMSLSDFAGVARMPKAVLVGVASQFTIMPLLGFTLANAFGFPPEIAAGVVLIGSAPSGVASNVMSYIAGANLPLSVTLTSVTTLMAPFMTPLLMKLLAGQFVEVEFFKMMLDIIYMIIVPIVLGLVFNRLAHGRAAWLDRALPVVSMVGIAVIITIITAAGRDSLLTMGVALLGAALIHNTSGYLLGYWASRMMGMDERSCRTIAIEVGMQNGGLASGLALQMGKVATVGLAPAVFGPLMNITGSILANWWRRKPMGDEPAPTPPHSDLQRADAPSDHPAVAAAS